MTRIYSYEELMFLSDDTVRQFLNHQVTCTTKTGTQLSGIVANFEVAANEPHHICGFIFDNGRRIGYGSIRSLTIEL